MYGKGGPMSGEEGKYPVREEATCMSGVEVSDL